MSHIPSFLRPGSPPRSPHVEVAGNAFAFPPSLQVPGFQPHAHSSETSNPYSPALRRSMKHAVLRPNKRDVVVSLVTLLFAWILLGLKHGSSESSLYGQPYGEAAEVDQAKASWYGSHYISKVSNKFSNLKTLWPGSAKELAQLEDVICPTLSDGTHGAYIHKGYSDTVTRLSISADNDEEEDDDEGVSGGIPASSEPGNEEAREPTGEELKFLSVKEAKEMWGDRIWAMEGMTWLFNDGQFIDHYYHFAAELLLGVWRAYTSLGRSFTSRGETSLPAPSRAWFIRMTDQSWSVPVYLLFLLLSIDWHAFKNRRDKPRFNSAILWSAFPSISVLYQDDWQDVARATASGKPKAYYFPKAILADRSAAFRGQACASTSRTVASAMTLGESNRWWWEPVRRQVLRFAGTPEDVLNRNQWGYGAVNPALLSANPDLKAALGHPEVLQPANFKPLVTYISRQSSRRRLTPESHEDLVQALEKHSKAKGWELKIVEAEKLTKEEQLDLAARTTIMLGVHGNGLTHLLWMPPTPQSAVIEMFVVGGFARDYQWTAQNLGIRHFAVRHDQYATAPNEPKVDYPEGFQGTSITVVGEVVAQLIDDRLDGKV
ncbi:hypothetical protein QFC24_004043 [Naganishia onofrii]|uniref:Uncharacterized protein n=1 Tax=Naganishia onofrii TaxID=1851511 RepID=A0ACC2XHU4_9TREE|nr:hypothetical protein QFC24_004043 [Naganishia onofrii]